MSLVTFPRQFLVDANGTPRVGAKANFYQAGTSTPIVVWTTPDYDVPHTNPVLSVAGGLFPAIYVDPSVNATYKVFITDSADSGLYTEDNVPALGFTQSDITQLLYPQTLAEQAAGITPINYGYPVGHVLRYGTNTTPGTTDMTLAFQRAGLMSLNPYAPADNYLVTGSTPIVDNQHWSLDGVRHTITGTTLQVFTVAAGVDEWSMRGAWTVTGDNDAAGAASGTAAAIKIVDSQHWFIENLTAKNIKGWGVLVQPGSSTSTRTEHGIVHNLQAYACYRGVEVQAGTGAEYVTIGLVNIARCNIGIYAAAGNVMLNGGSVSDNTDGIKIGNGSNHAHGIISGVSINHNTQYNVHCDNVVNGQTFSGCHIYGVTANAESAIFLDQCKGVQFNGGIMDCDIYNYKGASSGLNVIRNMYCPGAYGIKRQAGTNNGHDELLIIGCHGLGTVSVAGDAIDTTGVNINDPAFMYVLAKRAPASTQSFTSTVAADVIFDTEVSDRRGAYNNATGVTTIPASQGGIYRIRAELVFVGTGMSATASFVEIKVGSTGKRLFMPSIFGTTKLSFSICSDIYLDAADTVKLTATITGTTPVLGDTVYESSLTVERLS